MISKQVYEEAKKKALRMLEDAGICVTQGEKDCFEIADFGLEKLDLVGLEIIEYVNTDHVCAKELVIFPRQICPEHRHPPLPEKNYPGKEETFRCRAGEVYLYVEGESTSDPKGTVPAGDEAYYTVWNEIVLKPGEQYTLYPNTRHWFQAGDAGAIVSEFSTSSYDEADIFTDPRINRIPEIK